MRGLVVARFAVGASLAAASGGLLLALWVAANARGASGWAAAGFAAMAGPSVAFGAWLAAELGRPGVRFLAALVGGIATRFALTAVAGFGAARAGGDARGAALAGVVAGFLPVFVFEMVWLTRTSAALARRAETHG